MDYNMMTTNEIKQAGLDAGIPRDRIHRFIVDVHAKTQYLDADKAVKSVVREMQGRDWTRPLDASEGEADVMSGTRAHGKLDEVKPG